MKKLILILFALFCVNVAMSQIKTALTYQGFLTDPVTDDPVSDGNYDLTFKFYDESNSVLVTREVTTELENGIFTAIIGEGVTPNAPLPADIWAQELTLGVSVNGGSELTPRTILTTVPYAFQSEESFSINSGGSVPANTLTGTIDNSRLDADLQDLADGILSGNKIGSGINAANLTTGTLNEARISSLSASKLTGTINNARLDADLQDLADGQLSGSKVIPTFGDQLVTTTNEMHVGSSNVPSTTFQVTHGTGDPSSGDGLTIASGSTRWALYSSSFNGRLLLYYNDVFKGAFDDFDGAYTLASDRRLKQDIRASKPLLQKVKDIYVARFSYVDQPDQEQIGFIAQELQPLFPEMVRYQQGVDRFSVNYAGMSAVAIKAIQEQQVEIESLREELRQLKQFVQNQFIDNRAKAKAETLK